MTPHFLLCFHWFIMFFECNIENKMKNRVRKLPNQSNSDRPVTIKLQCQCHIDRYTRHQMRGRPGREEHLQSVLRRCRVYTHSPLLPTPPF